MCAAENLTNVTLIKESGQGAPLVVLFERGQDEFPVAVIERITFPCHMLALQTEPVNEENWGSITSNLQEFLKAHGVRQASFVAFGDSGAILQNLALSNLKAIRRMVLVNGATRPHPSAKTKVVDWIEERLPLGLPLRKVGKSFDSRPFLQRMRCPILLISSGDIGGNKRDEGEYLARHLPTAWLTKCDGPKAIAEQIERFQDVAAKRPQKNLGAAA